MTRLQLRTIGAVAVALLTACSDGPGGPGDDREIVAIDAGVHSTCALFDDGALECWGRPIDGSVSDDAVLTPTKLPGSVSVADFSVGDGAFGLGVCAAATDGSTRCWGMYSSGSHAIPYDPQPQLLQDSLALSDLAAGDGYVCGLDDGTAYCWGNSNAGVRGQGAPPASGEYGDLLVNRVAGDLSFTSLASGRFQTCGITAARDVYCWGYAALLGNPGADFDTECFSALDACSWTPLQVPGMSDATAISAGVYATCVVRSGGAVWCWDADIATETARAPFAVALPESATDVTVGNREAFACALGESGRAYCWGAPGAWRGSETQSPDPVVVSNDLRFETLSAGHDHVCGLDRDGAAWCWGENTYGEVGNGTRTVSAVPVPVQFGS